MIYISWSNPIINVKLHMKCIGLNAKISSKKNGGSTVLEIKQQWYLDICTVVGTTVSYSIEQPLLGSLPEELLKQECTIVACSTGAPICWAWCYLWDVSKTEPFFPAQCRQKLICSQSLCMIYILKLLTYVNFLLFSRIICMHLT